MYLKSTTAAICLGLVLSMTVSAQQSGDGAAKDSGKAPDTRIVSSACEMGFALTDTDDDGIVSRTEFESWRDSSFAQFDEDGDGQLTRGEFVNCMNNPLVTENLQLSPDRDMATMADADVDASGTLSPQEYVYATHRAQTEAQAGRPEALAVLRSFILLPPDMSDGALNDLNPFHVADGAARQFQALDVDGDGEMSSAEWTTSETLHERLAGPVGAAFDEMDSNEDGTVTLTEFHKYHDTRWKGAETAASLGRAQPTAAGTETGDVDSGGEPPAIYYFYFDPALLR